MATEQPVLTQTIIKTPDVSTLPALNAEEMLKIRVVDDTTKATAAQYGIAAHDYVGNVTALFKDATESANRVHKFLTGLRAKLSKTAEDVEAHCRREIVAYDNRVEQERLALQRKLQEQADREAREKAEADRKRQLEELRKAQAEAALKAQQAQDEAMPWETPAATTQVEELQSQLEAVAAAPIAYVAPQIIVPEAPKVEGVGSRNTPLKYRVVDLNALVQAAAKNPALVEYLEVNDAMVKGKLKTVGEKLGDFIPGVEAYRDKTVSFR